MWIEWNSGTVFRVGCPFQLEFELQDTCSAAEKDCAQAAHLSVCMCVLSVHPRSPRSNFRKFAKNPSFPKITLPDANLIAQCHQAFQFFLDLDPILFSIWGLNPFSRWLKQWTSCAGGSYPFWIRAHVSGWQLNPLFVVRFNICTKPQPPRQPYRGCEEDRSGTGHLSWTTPHDTQQETSDLNSQTDPAKKVFEDTNEIKSTLSTLFSISHIFQWNQIQ